MVTRIKAGPRMSQAIVHGNTVYLAGQVASDRSADTAGQTREVLASIDKLLAEAGTDKSHLLAATVYLTDMSTFNEMNAVWDAWVAPGCAPARATVGASLASSAYRVEIVVIAARP
ncbi:MAG TPA: RidA family protein [Steroidobacteraceae bacterium]|jgi:enamine deaminase RidA (YjgF/YER057c/UK114 family)|nr:RidA family protein [Steroidobacteraceae bacterium]